MRFAPTMSAKDQRRVEGVLPKILQGDETPMLAVGAVRLRRRGQIYLVLTRDRFLGIDPEGALTLEISTDDVIGAKYNGWNALLYTRLESQPVKSGTLQDKDWPVLRDVIVEVCPAVEILGSTQEAPQREPATASSEDVRTTGMMAEDLPGEDTPEARRVEDLPRESSTPGSVVDHLSQLASLHAQGALTDVEYAAAKNQILGLSPELPQTPSSPPPTPPTPPSQRAVSKPPPARRRGKRIKEMERTCTQDGTVWFVPLDVATMVKPSRLTISGLKMQEFGTTALLMPGGTTASTQLNRLEAAWARAQMARQCPTCGSQAFTERLVKH